MALDLVLYGGCVFIVWEVEVEQGVCCTSQCSRKHAALAQALGTRSSCQSILFIYFVLVIDDIIYDIIHPPH
jgi:hypothetical protein